MFHNKVMESRAYQVPYQQASKLRMDFFKEFILNKQTIYFKTQEERDWSYVAKREYNYCVTLKSLLYGFATANIFWSFGIYLKKKMIVWPLLVVTPVAYYFYQRMFFFKVNKRLFDMCNLGEEYELGKTRNAVLNQCNELQGIEDF